MPSYYIIESWSAWGLLNAYWLPNITIANKNSVRNLIFPCRYGLVSVGSFAWWWWTSYGFFTSVFYEYIDFSIFIINYILLLFFLLHFTLFFTIHLILFHFVSFLYINFLLSPIYIIIISYAIYWVIVIVLNIISYELQIVIFMLNV